jgi:hypothetical protein
MGFELNRIMKQYGVNTPGMANYSGTSAPSTELDTAYYAKMNPDLAKADITTPEQLQKHYNESGKKEGRAAYDAAAFGEQMRKYGLDQKSYDTYKTDYQNRLSNTPMYLQGQFDTGYGRTASTTPTGSAMRAFADKPGGIGVDQANRNIQNYFAQNPSASAADVAAAKKQWDVTDADIRNAMGSGFSYGDGKPSGYGSTGVRYANAPGGVGMDKYNSNINKYIADNPYATTAQIKAEGDKWGVSNKDMYNATGSYYGNQLSNPTYGAIPMSLFNKTPQNKADYYLQQRNIGYTDADLRGAADTAFGKQNEGDWAQLLSRAYPTYNQNIVDAYKSIGRSWDAGTIDAPGYNYWMNQLSTGAFKPENLNSTFAKTVADEKAAADAKAAEATRLATIANTKDVTGGLATSLDVSGNNSNIDTGYYAHGGSVHDLAAKYAQGGQVKTHYQTAGAVKLPSGYGSAEEEADFAQRFFTPAPVEINRVDMSTPPPPVTVDLMPAPTVAAAPRSALTEIAANNLKAEPMPAAPVTEVVPVAVPKAAAPFGDERMGNIQALLAAYGPKDSAYAADLKAARTSAKAESDAFANMLKTAMSSPEDAQSSKAEMYFRLAAAFGAPTKTGQFSENLGMVGKELGEYAKGKRASAREKLALGLEAQKLKMASSKEDLNTLRALSAEEMKDKRTIATELIKDYIKSGEPQSAAGKQALDEGLKPGTEAYQKRVGEIGNLNVEGKMAQISAALANVSTAQANLALNQEKFQNQKAQQAKLTGPEMKLKVETEDVLAQTNSALGILKQAYALNPNTFDTSVADMARRKALEVTDSKNPKVVATREQENLLEKAALSQLKSTFPGAISNDERKALQDVQGLGAKSREERARIMKNAYTALQSVSARHAKRLNDINQGVYRDTAAPIEGGPD